MFVSSWQAFHYTFLHVSWWMKCSWLTKLCKMRMSPANISFHLELYKTVLLCAVPNHFGLRLFWPMACLALICRVSLKVAETWKHQSELTWLFSVLFLRRCSDYKPGIPAWIVVTLMKLWSQQAEDLPLGQSFWSSNIQIKMRNWLQRWLLF